MGRPWAPWQPLRLITRTSFVCYSPGEMLWALHSANACPAAPSTQFASRFAYKCTPPAITRTTAHSRPAGAARRRGRQAAEAAASGDGPGGNWWQPFDATWLWQQTAVLAAASGASLVCGCAAISDGHARACTCAAQPSLLHHTPSCLQPYLDRSVMGSTAHTTCCTILRLPI